MITSKHRIFEMTIIIGLNFRSVCQDFPYDISLYQLYPGKAMTLLFEKESVIQSGHTAPHRSFEKVLMGG
jgi:hypothetical protein